jgi:hypothetical protein
MSNRPEDAFFVPTNAKSTRRHKTETKTQSPSIAESERHAGRTAARSRLRHARCRRPIVAILGAGTELERSDLGVGSVLGTALAATSDRGPSLTTVKDGLEHLLAEILRTTRPQAKLMCISTSPDTRHPCFFMRSTVCLGLKNNPISHWRKFRALMTYDIFRKID